MCAQQCLTAVAIAALVACAAARPGANDIEKFRKTNLPDKSAVVLKPYSYAVLNPYTTVKVNPDSTVRVISNTLTMKNNPDTTVNENPDTTVKENPDTTTKMNPDTTVKENPDMTVKENPDINVKQNPNTTVKENPDITVKQNLVITTKVNPETTVKQNPDMTVKENPDINVKQNPNTTVKENPDITVKQNLVITTKVNPETTVKQNPDITVKQNLVITTEVNPETTVKQNPDITTELNQKTLVEEKPVNERFPHAVLYGGTCGGTLISDKWVLTAAHCTLFSSGYSVLAGTNNTADGTGEVRFVERVVIHPLFTVGPYWLDADEFNIKQVAARWDFLLVELEEPFILDGKKIAAANIDERAVLEEGLRVGYAGYGTDHFGGTMRSQMHAMKLAVQSNATCSRHLEQYNAQDMLCVKGLPPNLDSACNGDSGSGLVDESGNLLGVASWVENDAHSCDKGALVVFARVAAVRDWIRQVTKI